MNIYLQQEIQVSQKNLRCADLQNDLLLVGAFDQKVSLYKLNYDKFEYIKNFEGFASNIYSVRFLDKDSFFVGLQNGKILLVTINGEVIGAFDGQNQVVSSIDVHKRWMVSGHWGGICKVWNLDSKKQIYSLNDHTHAVTVKFLNNGKLLTGSQNGLLHLWNADTFEKVNSVQAHNNIIRDIQCNLETILTCSNDCFIGIWSEDLKAISTYKPHASFIFSIAFSKSSDGSLLVYSGGEDLKFKLTQNEKELCCINYPKTIWKIITHKTQVLVIGEDGILRVFTSDVFQLSDMKLHDSFVKFSEIENLKNQEVTLEELAKFSKFDKMTTIDGVTEGEVKIFINQKKGEAYKWNNGKWEYICEVMNASALMDSQFFEGDDYFPSGHYDFVFDIQDNSKIPKLLPFNRTDDVLESTDKFIEREKMAETYKEQIMNFICKNSGVSSQPISKI